MVFYGINDLSDMERNRWVDDFVDCVIRRSETDSVPSTYLVVLVIIVPLILAQAFIASGVTALGDWFDGNEYEVVYYVSLYAECCIVSFVLFVLTRRSSSHLARDIVWMDSLIGYAESKGADASTLRGIRDEASRGRWTAKGWVGTAFWLAVTAYTIIQGFILFYGTGSDDGRGLMPFVYVYLLVMAQFVFTLGTTAGFPYRHDQLQCEFSREFSARAARFGSEVDAMEPSVRKARWIIHIVLFAVTLGVYSVVILLLANRRTNTHIRSQWGYESRVMISMIRHEDGIGIEGVGDNQPGNWLARLLFNAL